MKKIILLTSFITLALSSQAFAADTDYNNNDTAVSSGTPSTGKSTTTHHRHHKKSNASASTGRHPNAGSGIPTHSENINDSATSRQGLPSGETNGPVNGQSDDQNYGQPTNH